MKKSLRFFVFLIIASITILSTDLTLDSKRPKKSPITVDTYALKYVKQFKKDAEYFGVDFSTVLDSIDRVTFYPLHPNILGLYSGINRQIVINQFVALDSLIMMKVVYHEMGHLYGLPHDTGGIMGTGDSVSKIKRIYANPKNWELHKAYLFYMIKKHLDKSK